jgi:hypothetical protein
MARITGYNKDVHPKIAKRLIGLDYTEEQAAQHMAISIGTFNAWKKKYPEFLIAIQKGKYEPIKKVTASAYKRANGYDYEEQVFEVIYPEDNKGKKGKNGKPMGRPKKPEKRLVRTVVKHVAGDPTMQKFILTNKDKTKWQESSKIELGGQMEYIVKAPIIPNVIPDKTNKKEKK